MYLAGSSRQDPVLSCFRQLSLSCLAGLLSTPSCLPSPPPPLSHKPTPTPIPILSLSSQCSTRILFDNWPHGVQGEGQVTTLEKCIGFCPEEISLQASGEVNLEGPLACFHVLVSFAEDGQEPVLQTFSL